MMPTTGKQEGQDAIINGGGQMRVTAGGDIVGGAYFLGKGEGVISAGGKITGTGAKQFNQGPQLVMSGDQSDPITGDSKLSLNAGQGIDIAGVSDALVFNNFTADPSIKFFTYTDKSLLALKSLSGDVNLNSDINFIANITGDQIELAPDLTDLMSVYPASLDVTAFNGSILLKKDIVLYPSPESSINILAKQNISSNGGQFNLIMSDADPQRLPKFSSIITKPENDEVFYKDTLKKFTPSLINPITEQDIDSARDSGIQGLIHASTPLHTTDQQPARLVTQSGDIAGLFLNLPKKSIIQAGRDLKNTTLQIQQISPTDTSIISAGRDISFDTPLTVDGNLDTTITNSYKIDIAGPGDALVKTGRNLDLGSSVGLTTSGNLINNNLSSQGASLDVLVGLNGATPDYAGFISKYQDKPIYAEKFTEAKAVIANFMRQRTGNSALSVADALDAFKNLQGDETLPIQAQLHALISQVFFNEIRVAGSASADNKSVGK